MNDAALTKIDDFISSSQPTNGAIMLDLDGTALHEDAGKIFISSSVQRGVREISKLGLPVIINTLRFPLSVAKLIASEWLEFSAPIMPAILLNGSMTGEFTKKDDKIVWREHRAHPLSSVEIVQVMNGLRELLDNKIHDLIIFYYPRDWTKGEVIWVPNSNRMESIKQRYVSAERIHSAPIDALEAEFLKEDICMLTLLIDRPRDALMAYQHKEPSSFFTKTGINKAFGAKTAAEWLNFSLADTLGGGDNIMDNFLKEIGFSIIVGREDLPYKGTKLTLRVEKPQELGEILVTYSSKIRALYKINDKNQSRNREHDH